MDNRSVPELIKFNAEDYFTPNKDMRTKENLPNILLNNNGIKLVSEYYSDKYKMPNNLIITNNVDELVDLINHDDFKKIRETKGEIRIPFIIGSTVEVGRQQTKSRHSTPAVYIKNGDSEAVLVFDSIGTAANITVAMRTDYTVYTVNKPRQKDFYSCHTDALVFLRELTGLDSDGNYIIPDFLGRLKSENRVTQSCISENLYEISLMFDKLRVTAQAQDFLDYPNTKEEVVHQHKGKSETVKDFLKRYPPDETDSPAREKYVSNFLRVKGIKFSHIIEMQFYINQLKKVLGEHFTEKLRVEFISAAKSIIKHKDANKPAFLGNQQKMDFYELAQKYVKATLDLKAQKSTEEAHSKHRIQPK